MPGGVRRSATDSSRRSNGPPTPQRRAFSFKQLAHQSSSSPPQEPALVQQTYPVYRLEWETLKVYLEKKFPGYVFHERRVGFSNCLILFFLISGY